MSPTLSPTLQSPITGALTGANVILGTAGLHEPGAGPRQAAGSADRHLLLRMRVLRSALRSARLRPAKRSPTSSPASWSASPTGRPSPLRHPSGSAASSGDVWRRTRTSDSATWATCGWPWRRLQKREARPPGPPANRKSPARPPLAHPCARRSRPGEWRRRWCARDPGPPSFSHRQLRSAEEPPPTVRFRFTAAPGAHALQLTWGIGGKLVSPTARAVLWHTSWDSERPRPGSCTFAVFDRYEGASVDPPGRAHRQPGTTPFFSPDGEWLGYVSAERAQEPCRSTGGAPHHPLRRSSS